MRAGKQLYLNMYSSPRDKNQSIRDKDKSLTDNLCDFWKWLWCNHIGKKELLEMFFEGVG